MKLAFTTLGCPNWNMDTIIEQAVNSNYDGVDFRGYLGEMDIFTLPEFTTNIEQTKEKFRKASLEIPCFSSSIRLFTESEQQDEKNVVELREYCRLCVEFDTPFIRVFGGSTGEVKREDAVRKVKENLQVLLDIIQDFDVKLLIETHDSWTAYEDVLSILKQTHSEKLQVLWDVHHPYRLIDEQPEETLKVLSERIKYIHIKDSYITEDTDRGFQLCLTGKGDIPLKKMYHLLTEYGYDGYYTFEWEKVWWPNIEEPEIAIPQYAQFMNTLKKNNWG